MVESEKLPKWKALAVLSSDALSSSTYATEEILLTLIAVSSIALNWSVPVSFAILALLFIVTLSYRKTIETYRNGGGAYIFSKENLGVNFGLISGAALLFGIFFTQRNACRKKAHSIKAYSDYSRFRNASRDH